MHRYLIILFLITATIFLQGQNLPTKNNLWTRFATSYSFTDKFRFEAELQYRSQNDIEGTKSPFTNNMLRTIRFNGFYKINNNILLTISPFAYFHQSPIIYTAKDKLKSPSGENRFSIGLESCNRLSSKLSFANRAVIEYRNLLSADDVIRLRTRFMLRYDINEKQFVNLYDELFTNVMGIQKHSFFDQNRIGLYFNIKPHPKFKIETGYMYALRFNSSTLVDQPENNIIFDLYYQIN